METWEVKDAAGNDISICIKNMKRCCFDTLVKTDLSHISSIKCRYCGVKLIKGRRVWEINSPPPREGTSEKNS